jgi:glutamyl-tRNA reductase
MATSQEFDVDLQKLDATETCEQTWQTPAHSGGQALGRVTTLYRESLERIQVAEFERLCGRLPHLNERSWREIRQFADRLVQTMLDPPLESLRDESRNGSSQALLDAFQRLFQLSTQD